MATPPATEVEVEAGRSGSRNPDRVIYPATDRTPEATKLDIVRYYASVGDGIYACAAPPADDARAVAKGRLSRHQARNPVRPPRRRVLSEAGAEGRACLGRDRADRLPVRPLRRRGVPDRAGSRRLGRADRDDHVPPVAGAARRRRASRRAAHRPRPPARHRLLRRRRGGARGACAARRARLSRIPEDVRQPRRPRLSAHRAAMGLHRRAARRDRASAARWRAGCRIASR